MNCNSYNTEAQFLSTKPYGIENKLAPPKTLQEIQDYVILSQHNIIFGKNKTDYSELVKEIGGNQKHVLYTKEIQSQLSKSLLKQDGYLKNFPAIINNLDKLFGIDNFQIVLDSPENFEDKLIGKYLVKKINNIYDNSKLDKKNILDTIKIENGKIHFAGNILGNKEEQEIKEKLFKTELTTSLKNGFKNIIRYVNEQYSLDHDGLTGLKSRNYGDKKAEQMLEKAKEDKSSLSVFFIDLDHFKYINDTYGHANGDFILKKASNILNNIAKKYSGLATRYGGEEFYIILDNLTFEEAENIGNKIIKEINNMDNFLECGEERIGVSIGLEHTNIREKKNNISIGKILERADKKMYMAKRGGRNKLVFSLKNTKNTKKCINFSFTDNKQNIDSELQKIKLKENIKRIKYIIFNSINKIENGEILGSLGIRYQDTPIIADLLVNSLNNYCKRMNKYPKAYLEVLRFLKLSEKLDGNDIGKNIINPESANINIKKDDNDKYSYSFTENNPFYYDAYGKQIKKSN